MEVDLCEEPQFGDAGALLATGAAGDGPLADEEWQQELLQAFLRDKEETVCKVEEIQAEAFGEREPKVAAEAEAVSVQPRRPRPRTEWQRRAEANYRERKKAGLLQLQATLAARAEELERETCMRAALLLKARVLEKAVHVREEVIAAAGARAAAAAGLGMRHGLQDAVAAALAGGGGVPTAAQLASMVASGGATVAAQQQHLPPPPEAAIVAFWRNLVHTLTPLVIECCDNNGVLSGPSTQRVTEAIRLMRSKTRSLLLDTAPQDFIRLAMMNFESGGGGGDGGGGGGAIGSSSGALVMPEDVNWVAVVAAANLSPEQKQEVATVYALFQARLEALHEERRQLRGLMAARFSGGDGSDHSGDSSGNSRPPAVAAPSAGALSALGCTFWSAAAAGGSSSSSAAAAAAAATPRASLLPPKLSSSVSANAAAPPPLPAALAFCSAPVQRDDGAGPSVLSMEEIQARLDANVRQEGLERLMLEGYGPTLCLTPVQVAKLMVAAYPFAPAAQRVFPVMHAEVMQGPARAALAYLHASPSTVLPMVVAPTAGAAGGGGGESQNMRR